MISLGFQNISNCNSILLSRRTHTELFSLAVSDMCGIGILRFPKYLELQFYPAEQWDTSWTILRGSFRHVWDFSTCMTTCSICTHLMDSYRAISMPMTHWRCLSISHRSNFHRQQVYTGRAAYFISNIQECVMPLPIHDDIASDS